MQEVVGLVIWIILLVIFMIAISLLEQENFATFFAFWFVAFIFLWIIFVNIIILFQRAIGYRIN